MILIYFHRNHILLFIINKVVFGYIELIKSLNCKKIKIKNRRERELIYRYELFFVTKDFTVPHQAT